VITRRDHLIRLGLRRLGPGAPISTSACCPLPHGPLEGLKRLD
jgi:hypothetical protein